MHVIFGSVPLVSVFCWFDHFHVSRENIKNAEQRSIGKTTTLHVHHTFLYISLPSPHDYDAKCQISHFMEDVNKRRQFFLSISKIACNPREINLREIRLHLTFSAN